MVAAEAKRPRTYIKAAFKTVYWRFGIFFIGGALAAGIVVAHNDPELVAIVSGTGEGGGTAAASPYVIAMKNMGIVGLPHFVNALLGAHWDLLGEARFWGVVVAEALHLYPIIYLNATAALANLDPEKMVKDGVSAPMHPGAVKYYKEKGWIK